MENIQFDKLFETSNKSVLDFFQVSGAGYYIPEYQRGYSWDKDNISQLLTDIEEGVSRLMEINDFNQEIHFLGTIITVTDNGLGTKYKDPKGKPTRIDMIIDGQQRVITISIMASIILKELKRYLKAIKVSSSAYNDVKEIVDTWNKKLMDIISFDLLKITGHLRTMSMSHISLSLPGMKRCLSSHIRTMLNSLPLPKVIMGVMQRGLNDG